MNVRTAPKPACSHRDFSSAIGNAGTAHIHGTQECDVLGYGYLRPID
jgi:hypothetical protein